MTHHRQTTSLGTIAVCAVVCLVLASTSLSGAESGSIELRRQPHARVLLDGSPVAAAPDSEGLLRLEGVAPGWHVVTVDPGGTPPIHLGVRVSTDATVEVDLRPGVGTDQARRSADVAPIQWLDAPEESAGARCIYPNLPRPGGAVQAFRDQLTAAGQWQASRTRGRTPPANPQVGDTWDWYIWDLGGFPVATLKPCTVRGMGANSYVVIDDDEWNVSIDQADVDRIVTHFENQSVGNFPAQGIWDLNTSHFGDPPNPLDGLDRVFLLYYHFGINADGYFWSFDQFPDGTEPFASNEADVVYLATEGGGGNPAGNYMLAVAAHEFEHMIHYARDVNEATWVDEGLGELAMWLFGNPDTISSFNSNPDNSLIDWGSATADYIQTYLWSLYAYEQFGGLDTVWDLIHDPGNGMSGYLSALTGNGYMVTMEDVFGDWSVANFLDDPAVPDGRFGYVGDDLPPFSAFRTHSTYPASGSGGVQNWATDYIRLNGLDGIPTIGFDGVDTRNFRVAALALDPVLPTLVREVVLDGVNVGTLEFTEADGYGEVILTVANVYPVTSGTYSYTVDVFSTLVFADDFESGNTDAWSVTVP